MITHATRLLRKPDGPLPQRAAWQMVGVWGNLVSKVKAISLTS